MNCQAHSWVILATLSLSTAAVARGDDAHWWPEQRSPRSLIRTGAPQALPQPHDACQMLLQSVAGLAAQGVNDGRAEELVWVTTTNPDIEAWYAALLRRQPSLRVREVTDLWDLVGQYKRQGLIKGYLLYRSDSSRGNLNDHRPGMDPSVNVATTLCGLLGGILVDERLEPEAKKAGLQLLVDARDKTQAWCFATYKDQLNRRMLCVQDPKKPHARDLAIAHRAFTMYGGDEPLQDALQWLEPLSPILGWNGGDEFETTKLSTVYGHIQTATDWCMNLPVLMAGSSEAKLPRAKALDPASIDWTDARSAISFVETDGDNVQWLEGSFFRNSSYWASPDRGRFPFGWSCCFTHLAQLCPPAIEYAFESRTPNDSFVEWGGGYYYPDLFGLERADRWGLLARHARRTWEQMQRTGTRIIGFNVAKLDSADALRAYQTIAGECDGLLAILVFQYAPYEAGAGRTFWVKDRTGLEVPVISARYSIWEHGDRDPRRGTPAKVAREIRDTVRATAAADLPRYDWAIAHAWSYFRRAPGSDESAEDLPQTTAPSQGGVRGYTPIAWCAERLPETIRVISPEELAWRLRMRRNPEQTRQAIGK